MKSSCINQTLTSVACAAAGRQAAAAVSDFSSFFINVVVVVVFGGAGVQGRRVDETMMTSTSPHHYRWPFSVPAAACPYRRELELFFEAYLQWVTRAIVNFGRILSDPTGFLKIFKLRNGRLVGFLGTFKGPGDW